MKYYLLALVTCLVLMSMGCAEGAYYSAPPGVYSHGEVEFCDDFGCRMISSNYYYVDGAVVYWDPHFGCWIGPHGWYGRGSWHSGWVSGYHNYYRSFHNNYSHGGSFRGGGYHGGGHHR